MIVCPNCSHQNPEGATQCEACYTPLPTTTSCPNCGASVQSDAAFCGQCGYGLQATTASEEQDPATTLPTIVSPAPEPITPAPLPEPEPVATTTSPPNLEKPSVPDLSVAVPPPSAVSSTTSSSSTPNVTTPATQLQQQSAGLLHVQTNVTLELPQNLPVIHIGKPNDLIPPDIDVSGFPNSEVVSRTHADIRVEGDAYYIEDIGSSNGTYINNIALPKGNRHRLRPGDRISLGKGDLVSLIFQLS